MTDYFLLDPTHKDFPERQKLKFLTVYGEQHTFIIVALIAPFILTLTIYIMVVLVLIEWGYLLLGVTTQAVVTETCQKSDDSFTYTFDVTDARGNVKHYVGKKDDVKLNSCPKVGDAIEIIYIQLRPITSRPLTTLTLWEFIGLLLLTLAPVNYYVWMRELLGSVRAFIKALPKYNRLKLVTRSVDGMITGTRKAPKVKFAPRRDGYYIEVEYEFVVDNMIYRNKQVKRRTDLNDKTYPKIGTPVRVLYADADAYVML